MKWLITYQSSIVWWWLWKLYGNLATETIFGMTQIHTNTNQESRLIVDIIHGCVRFTTHYLSLIKIFTFETKQNLHTDTYHAHRVCHRASFTLSVECSWCDAMDNNECITEYSVRPRFVLCDWPLAHVQRKRIIARELRAMELYIKKIGIALDGTAD